jgi:phage-related protein
VNGRTGGLTLGLGSHNSLGDNLKLPLDNMSFLTYTVFDGTSGKPLVWLEGEVKSPPFSHAARLEAGFLLRSIQQGAKLGLPHSRPMPTVAPRCHELRIPDEKATWRIIYRIDPDAIIIAEVFSKKSKQTPKYVISNAKNRLKHYDELV